MNPSKLAVLLRHSAPPEEESVEYAAIHEAADWIERAAEVLRKMEWHVDGYRTVCPVCDEYPALGHAPDCALAALIGAKTQ